MNVSEEAHDKYMWARNYNRIRQAQTKFEKEIINQSNDTVQTY